MLALLDHLQMYEIGKQHRHYYQGFRANILLLLLLLVVVVVVVVVVLLYFIWCGLQIILAK